jgi:4-amino-4-deoxy-L-arabinose transferase-like glycosyltransferase
VFNNKKGSFIWFFVSIICGAAAMLIKPFAAFFLFFPLGLLALESFFLEPKQRKKVILCSLAYTFFVILPFLLWRFWMRQFPEGIPANAWLFNEGGIRFRPAWFRWLFSERLGKLILGGWGLVFLVLGLLDKKFARADWYFYSWVLGILAFFSIIARGNIQHDYYQILVIPALCIYLARGISFLLSVGANRARRLALPLIALVVLLFSLGFSWYEVSGYYQINRPEIVEAGRVADRLLPINAKVIAPYGGDTAFLYQINRPGWPGFTHSVTELRERGATHIVAVNFDARIAEAEEKHRVLLKTDKYVIISLGEQR